MASNMMFNQYGGFGGSGSGVPANMNFYGGGGGGGGQMNQMGMSGMPTFSQFNQWSQQMGQRPGADPYQIGQNAAVDSNAPFRAPMQRGDFVQQNPYGMQQSQQSPYTWNGSGWDKQPQGIAQGEPRPMTEPYQSKNQFSTQPRPQTDPPQQFGARPNVLPGPGGQISTRPMPPTTNQGWGPAGPPQMQPRPRPNLAPGQQPYNGPKIAPMQRPPQSAFGQQNPTRYVPGFNPQGPAPWNPTSQNPQQQAPYRTY